MTTGDRFDGALRLADLVHPLTVPDFIDRHWLPGSPHHGAVTPDVVSTILDVDGLRSPEALMALHDRDVRVFGPNGERKTVPAADGLDYLSSGHTLYVDYVHRTIPAAHRLVRGVASDMGVEPWQLTLEAFAGAAGSTSTRHFDHDVTVQVLLAGEKDWTFEPNLNIVNPLQPFHPPRSSEEKLAAFGEEAYADDPVVTASGTSGTSDHAAGVVRFHAVPGSTVFLPRGWWHSTRSLTDTWSFNVVFHSVSWARAFARALEIRLHAEPQLRGYCGGFIGTERVRTGLEQVERDSTMSKLRSATHAALSDISDSEVPLALLGFIGRVFRWAPDADHRCVTQRDGAWRLTVGEPEEHSVSVPADMVGCLQALCRLRSNFRWDHLPPLLGGASAGDVYDVLLDLESIGAIEVVHSGVGR